MPVIGTLPRGRHSLSREQVADSQRTRLLRATVELVTERGFASLTLTDLVGRAGVARSTFYEHFADKRECFLAAFEYAADRVLQRVLTVPPAAGEHVTPVHAYVAGLLELCLEEPGLVRLVASDAEGLGPAAAERQCSGRGRLAEQLVALHDVMRRDHPRLPPLNGVRALAIVGAITEVLQHTLHTDGLEALPVLQEELSTIALAILEAPPV